MGNERRSAGRARVAIPVLFTVAGQGGTFTGKTRNANGNCALVETSIVPPVGSIIDLKFLVADDDSYSSDLGLDLRATVTRLDRSPDGEMHGMVICFHNANILHQQVALQRPA